jgi:hypothetical protein
MAKIDIDLLISVQHLQQVAYMEHMPAGISHQSLHLILSERLMASCAMPWLRHSVIVFCRWVSSVTLRILRISGNILDLDVHMLLILHNNFKLDTFALASPELVLGCSYLAAKDARNP